MDWKQLLAYITGIVDQESLLHNAYLVTENRILCNQLQGRVLLSDGERQCLAELETKLVHLAQESRSWGYDRIAGALQHLGYTISGQIDRNARMAWRRIATVK
jgi:hypothetical protein